MARLALLSTDFDGTLIMHPSDGRCTPAFADVLLQHKSSGGVWAVNTGRSLEHAQEGIAQFQAPHPPDYLLTNEREIFLRAACGNYLPHTPWNSLCDKRHDDLFLRSEPVIVRVRERASRSPDVTIIEEAGRPVGLVTSSEHVMEEIAGMLDNECAAFPDFSYQRNTVYLRFCHIDYNKGTALRELCCLAGIHPSAVLAAGDHFNDLSMLDGTHAAFPCCPSNAIAEIKAAVGAAGGYIATKPAADGIAEAWHFFTRNAVGEQSA